MIEAELFSYLEADTSLADLVGEEIYPVIMDDDSLFPAVVITIINNKELQSINYREPYGFDIRVQIDCYAKTLKESLIVKEAVRNAMHSFTHKAHDLNSRTLPYEPDTKLHRQLIEFNLKG